MSLVLATIDHLYFDEDYRSTVSVMGIFALSLFFVGIIVTVIKGVLDKRKNDG